MRITNDVYVSDLFAVPEPKRAASPADFRRKLALRRMLWGALPYLLEGALFLLCAGVILWGLLALFCGLR